MVIYHTFAGILVVTNKKAIYLKFRYIKGEVVFMRDFLGAAIFVAGAYALMYAICVILVRLS